MTISPPQFKNLAQDASGLGSNLGFLPAVPGVSDLHFIGTSSPQTLQNLITSILGGPGDMTVFGAEPTYSPGYATTLGTGANGYKTLMADSGTFTMAVVARAPSLPWNTTTPYGMIGGTLNSAAVGGAGFSLHYQGNNGAANAKLQATLAQSGAAATSVSLTIGSGAATWKMLAMTLSGGAAAGGLVTLYDLSDGISSGLTLPAIYLPSGATPVEIGTNPYLAGAGATAGSIDLAFEAFVPGVALTQSQLQALYAQIKARLAGLASPIAI